jgi:hypothetical protein
MTYLATQRYASSYYPGGFAAGDTLDLDDVTAEAINRDSPGTLVLPPAGAEAVKADRHQKAAPARRDRGDEEPISRASFKAVRE